MPSTATKPRKADLDASANYAASRVSDKTLRAVASCFSMVTEIGNRPAGWDGGSARPPNAKTIALSKSLIAFCHFDRLAPDQIAAMKSGGVAIYWFFGESFATAELTNAGGIAVGVENPRTGAFDTRDIEAQGEWQRKVLELVREARRPGLSWGATYSIVGWRKATSPMVASYPAQSTSRKQAWTDPTDLLRIKPYNAVQTV